tara:strand:+ start:380 stop:586 length:207 start_codon:yes stop_codon:yes gene_type:complete
MKKKLFNLLIIIFGIIIIYFLKTGFSEYNLERTVSACILAQKQTSKSFDLEKSKKYCEEEVKKEKENY